MKGDDAVAVERGVQVVLAGVLGLSLAVPALVSGSTGAWSLPPLARLDWRVLAGSAAVIATTAACLWLIERAHDRFAGAARALASLALCAPMAAVFYALGPLTHIGDWDWVMSSAERGQLFGRWYGATALYAAVHALVRPAGWTALESVRLCSSVCGALSAYLFFRLLRALGTTDVLRAWPFLYLAAFGVVGVGLAHVEIYAAVVLVMLLVLWLGVEVAARPSPPRLLAFAAASAAAALTYVSAALLLPACIGLLLWVGYRAWAVGQRRLAAAAIGAFAVLPVLLALVGRFGPPAEGDSLWSFWVEQVGRVGTPPTSPPFHPPDVFWSRAPNLMAPAHWFSAAHLGDFAQSLFLDDRAGIALALVLLGLGLRRGRRAAAFCAAVIFLLAVAVPFAAYAFTAVNQRAMPWDWDVRSHLALTTSALAAALLATSVRRPYSRRSNALLILVGVAAQVSGMLFLHACVRQPEIMGPPTGGLRLAVTPTRIEVTQSGKSFEPVWFWLYDDGDQPIEVNWSKMEYTWMGAEGVSPSHLVHGVRVLLGSRSLVPHAFACLADVAHVPLEPGKVAMLPNAGVGEVLEGTLMMRVDDDPARPPLRLLSNPVQLVVRQR